jgi:hypothetical protein
MCEKFAREPAGSVKYEYIVQVYQAALQGNFTKIGFTPAR